jgi:transcriptional regulator with XRE-family HTH domain
MTKAKKVFECVECGGDVCLVTGPGRVREYRIGLEYPAFPVPNDFPTKVCSGCKEVYMDLDDLKRLDELQTKDFCAWLGERVGKLVAELQGRHGVTLREIESACGVTGTYLSHVIAGRREASTTLLRLLEAFKNHADEFEKYVGKSTSKLEEGSTEAMLSAPNHNAQALESGAKKYEKISPAHHSGDRPGDDGGRPRRRRDSVPPARVAA